MPSTDLKKKKGHPNPLKGKKMPEEWRKNLCKPKSITHTHSLETRKKISESHKGNKSVNWKGGITTHTETLRHSMEYRLWRESVFKRDGFTCQECNDAKGGNLQAHHIKPFSTNPELHFAIDNGVTLCKLCHSKTESYGGRQTHKNKEMNHGK